jgi:hypothetical protein
VTDTPPSDGRRRLAGALALAAIALGTIALRCRLLGVPLERDEGEYAYMGALILRGDVPYLAAHNMKLPGTYYAYAAILALLGERDVAIRLALVVVNLATAALVHRLGRILVDETTGLAAAATYVVLSIGPAMLGFTANAEHFVLLPAVAGTVLLADVSAGSRTMRRLVVVGLLLGLAAVMKQPGAAFVVFGLLQVMTSPSRSLVGRVRDATTLATAALVPYGLTCLAMWTLGAFAPFWFWTVTYAREYTTMISLGEGLARLTAVGAEILRSAPLIWSLVAIGLTALFWDARGRRARRFLLTFLACSALAVSPGLRFTDHYFLLLLPAASVLAGLATSALARAVRTPVPAALVRVGLPAVAIAAALVRERAVLLDLPPDAVSRAVYGRNPFPEARVIGRWLGQHTRPDERIAVIGSEPEIYFYAGRPGATSYIYTYPLMEPQPFATRMQAEMVSQLDRERPRMIVMVNVDTSWTRRPESASTIFDWTARTVNADYVPVALAEIPADGPTTYRWGDDARTAVPRERAYVAVFERRA